MEAAYSSEALIPIYQPTQRHIFRDINRYCISLDCIRLYFPQFFSYQNYPFASASRNGCAGTADTVYSHTEISGQVRDNEYVNVFSVTDVVVTVRKPEVSERVGVNCRNLMPAVYSHLQYTSS